MGADSGESGPEPISGIRDDLEGGDMSEAERGGGRMRIRLSPERRVETLNSLQSFWREEFDEEMSEFRAERVLDFILRSVGPPLYNQAVADTRGFILRKLEDLDGELYEPQE